MELPSWSIHAPLPESQDLLMRHTDAIHPSGREVDVRCTMNTRRFHFLFLLRSNRICHRPNMAAQPQGSCQFTAIRHCALSTHRLYEHLFGTVKAQGSHQANGHRGTGLGSGTARPWSSLHNSTHGTHALIHTGLLHCLCSSAPKALQFRQTY